LPLQICRKNNEIALFSHNKHNILKTSLWIKLAGAKCLSPSIYR